MFPSQGAVMSWKQLRASLRKTWDAKTLAFLLELHNIALSSINGLFSLFLNFRHSSESHFLDLFHLHTNLTLKHLVSVEGYSYGKVILLL